jgi:hypothetical protein
VIRVVNVRDLRTPEERAGVVYVAGTWAGWLGHPLGNRFRRKYRLESGTPDEQAQARAACIAEYRGWLLALPDLEEQLADLWGQTRHGELPLGCWCSPLPCHADILAALLAERFLPNGG